MEVDIVITITLAAVVSFVIAQLAKILRSAAMHKTLRKAIEHGQPLAPELVEQLDRAPGPGETDQRAGFVLIALALALFAAAAIVASPDNFRAMSAIALFPLFVGAALLLRLRLARRGNGE